MTDYTIVEPSFELWEPCTPDNYLQHIEKAARTCYKSEEHIKEGSAEKLLDKIINKYGHHSVIEHANVTLKIKWGDIIKPWKEGDIEDQHKSVYEWLQSSFSWTVPLLSLSQDTTTFCPRERWCYISGNIRMWKEWMEHPSSSFRAVHGPEGGKHPIDIIKAQIAAALDHGYPFFFNRNRCDYNPDIVELADTMSLMKTTPGGKHIPGRSFKKHICLTGKFIGSRTMSHQLVRHRLCAFSQESQRYCNYGKKGFQFIMPPTCKEKPGQEARFTNDMLNAYGQYLEYLNDKIPPEDARAVLPNATKTEVVVTSTLENWKHMIEHRGHNPKAQWEIRELFLEAEKQINELLGWEIYE